MRIYRDLARWYPLIADADEYADETDHICRLMTAMCERTSATLLELSSGPGHMASHLKSRLRCTLTDPPLICCCVKHIATCSSQGRSPNLSLSCTAAYDENQ
jgi:hypothetical protein